MTDKKLYDLVIIGAAAAGSAAAVYASRRNLNFKIVSKDIGGEVALSGEVGNFPGIINITGFELAQNFRKHVESYGNEIDEGAPIKTKSKWGIHREAPSFAEQATETEQLVTISVPKLPSCKSPLLD